MQGLRVVHMVFVISWMAGLLYLPRLFVYHTRVLPGSQASHLFILMERRLLRVIMIPSAFIVFATGIVMATLQGYWHHGWFQTKFGLALVLLGYHLFLARTRQHFAAGTNVRSEKFFRVINEIPTLLMIAIVIFAIVRP